MLTQRQRLPAAMHIAASSDCIIKRCADITGAYAEAAHPSPYLRQLIPWISRNLIAHTFHDSYVVRS